MVVNRGDTPPQPTDGRQDERPWIRCSHCKRLAKCYRGPLLKVVIDEHGSEWEHYAWSCSACFSATVGEALRAAETE